MRRQRLAGRITRFNPWWGCVATSPGCDNCYAETFAQRLGQDVWGKDAPRRIFGEGHWALPLRWSGRVFCGSMCDVFELRHGLDAERERLWDLIDRTPDLTWQLLTKRPENVPRLAPTRWLDTWPAHVWLGTTVEDAVRRDLRVPRLIAVPGVAVRFVSCEPLLGPVSFRWAKWEGIRGHNHLDGLRQLDWVIVGGESGPHHRPMNLDWVRSIRDECDAAGVPFFFKQVGGRTPIAGGDKLDGEIRKAFPRE